MVTRDIKTQLKEKYLNKDFRKNTIEIQDCHFEVDKPYIIEGIHSEFDEQWYIDWYDPIINEHNQIQNLINKLIEDPYTRQAQLIMSYRDGYQNNNFVCTFCMQVFLNYIDNKWKMTYIVNMRSNDVRRFPDDVKWHNKVINKILDGLQSTYNASLDKILWNAGSMHIYDKDFEKLID